MKNKELLENVQKKANQWLSNEYDENTRKQVENLINNTDSGELIDSFYKDLEFGTGGLRGIMGVGSNRMNIYTVGAATQGLANYLNKTFNHLQQISICIGYDCRNNSKLFANTVANIFSANGIKAYIFEDLRPTPEMSYAIRELKCQSGVIITASHNPKEYNGYKAYWEDGAQIVRPHDTNIIDEVKKVQVKDIKFNKNENLIEVLGTEMDEKYINAIKSISLNPESIKRHKDLKIVFTPIHGTTVKMVPKALRAFGFENIINVPEQDVVSGEFPTVISANPEEPAALKLALDRAKETDAEIVMACDPDGDRIGISVKDDYDNWVLINGNQTAILYTYYLLKQRKEKGLMKGNEYCVKTIVTSELMKDITEDFGAKSYDAYTGFKWIADTIRQHQDEIYVGGGEESFGYMPTEFTRDKDGVVSAALMAEIFAWAKDQGKTLFELLKDIYVEHGFSHEKMIYIVRKGITGAQEIEDMMHNYRYNRPETINGSKIIKVKDYLSRKEINVLTKDERDINFDTTSNVLQFYLEDGSKISVRPSGTEPKIKYYFEVREDLRNTKDFYDITNKAENKISDIIKDMNLN